MTGRKTICHFGIYNPAYSRTRVLQKGLIENGIQVIPCHSSKLGWKKSIDLIKKHWRIRKYYDVMLVGYPGQRVILLAKILAVLSRKPLIFDVFISVYDTRIFDREYHRPGSLRSVYYWLQDWFSCQLSDIILLDTYAHIDFFVNTFHVPKNKFRRILVGSDESVIRPKEPPRTEKKFLVHFHGTFIPLQGIQYIIQAAKILEPEEIHFNLVGKGQTYHDVLQTAEDLDVKNVTFMDPVPYNNLAHLMNNANLCLGIFGDTNKAGRVIPNKVYEALAANRPCLTGDTPAIRELFTDRENILLCRVADPEDLAKKILEIKNSPALGKSIAHNGYNFFLDFLSPSHVTKDLAKEITQL